jgi:hypothetical protein
MVDDRHERERIVIESSIVAVTLLFIVAGIREVTGEPTATYALSMVGVFFVLAAIIGTLIMFLPRPILLPLIAIEFASFVGGLAGLLTILCGIAYHEVGAPLDIWMNAAVFVSLVAFAFLWYVYPRVLKHSMPQV